MGYSNPTEVECFYTFLCPVQLLWTLVLCQSAFEDTEPSLSFERHNHENSSLVRWTVVMFSQFPVEGSLRLVDASSEVKEVPVLEIRCPTYSTSSSPNSVFHGAAPILCEYCSDTHHPKRKISIHRRYISHIYPANTLLAMLCWKKEPELLRSMATRFHSNRP